MVHSSPPPHRHAETRATARFTFEVAVNAPPREAIQLFTPEGERKWAEGWDPIYVNALDSGSANAGTVFTTDAHSVKRVWVIDEYERGCGVIRYTVFAPDRSITRIEVRVSPQSSGSIARVSYDRTALTPDADADVVHFSLHAHTMQSEWQSALDAIRK